MTELVFRTGPQAGRRVSIEADLVLGRQGADLVLEDGEVSRRHAVVRIVDERPQIEDLGSTNGTFVNGVRIDSATDLKRGDAIRVGQTRLELDEDWQAAETSASTAVHPDVNSSEVLRDDPRPQTDEHARSTEPLATPPATESSTRRLDPRWLWAGAALVALLAAVLLYNALTGGVSKRDFVSAGNDICRAADSSFNGGVLRSDVPDKRIVQQVREARAIRMRAGSALRALEQPDGMARELNAFLSSLRSTTKALAAYERALDSGRAGTMKEALEKLRSAAEKEAGQARKVGLGDCGRVALS